MDDILTPEEIKAIRKKYKLSQRAFARALGIGEASIARYENGQPPSKAMSNLIRAAAIPRFMMDCLAREEESIPEKQQKAARKIIYSEVYFNDKGEPMDVNEIYSLTLTQEVLNEKAWSLMADLSRLKIDARENGDEYLELIYRDIEMQLALLAPTIIDEENFNKVKLSRFEGELESYQVIIESLSKKAA